MVAGLGNTGHSSSTRPSGLDIPHTLQRSRLMQRGGYEVLPALFEGSWYDALTSEALRAVSRAEETWVRHSDHEEGRGGNPARRFLTVAGGAVQTALYQSGVMQDLLSSLTGLPVRPTGEGGTFTYYVRPGDFLSIHRDILTCDVAVITCLFDNGRSHAGGKLCLYPDRLHDPLSAIRKQPIRGARAFRLEARQTLVLFGGVVPHCVLPVTSDQKRVVSVLCYQVTGV
jgi:hypothetical protein